MNIFIFSLMTAIILKLVFMVSKKDERIFQLESELYNLKKQEERKAKNKY